MREHIRAVFLFMSAAQEPGLIDPSIVGPAGT